MNSGPRLLSRLRAIVALLAVVTSESAWGQCEVEELLASDGAAFDRFSVSVAISGNVAIIGASHDDDNGADSGSAYVYRYDGSTWVEEVELLASDGAASDRFGSSVAISGDVVIVGADADDDNGQDSGSVYVYRYNGSTWVEEDKLLASDGIPQNRFGEHLATDDDGDVVIVGVPKAIDRFGTPTGAAYVYRYDGLTWSEEVKLVGSDGEELDQFGFSVAVDGNVAVIGARFDYDVDHKLRTGAAYVYRFDGSMWGDETKLLASDAQVEDQFGYSVAISDDNAIVGSVGHDDNGTTSGSAYVLAGLIGTDCNGNGVPDSCENLCATDVDCDGVITVLDLVALMVCFGQPAGPGCESEDINLDGTVNVLDLIDLLLAFGQTCP